MKILKKTTLLFCLSIFCLTAYSQGMLNDEDSKPAYKKQIGVNSTALISQLINFSSSFSLFNSDYIFIYKKQKGVSNFRFGFGGSMRYEKGDFASGLNASVNLRFGSERFTDITKRWRVYYGGDFKTGFAYTNNSFLDEPVRSVYGGGGPVCGLQFNINARLSLSTEASYDLLVSTEKDRNNSTWGIATGFQVPNFFNLNFDF